MRGFIGFTFIILLAAFNVEAKIETAPGLNGQRSQEEDESLSGIAAAISNNPCGETTTEAISDVFIRMLHTLKQPALDFLVAEHGFEDDEIFNEVTEMVTDGAKIFTAIINNPEVNKGFTVGGPEDAEQINTAITTLLDRVKTFNEKFDEENCGDYDSDEQSCQDHEGCTWEAEGSCDPESLEPHSDCWNYINDRTGCWDKAGCAWTSSGGFCKAEEMQHERRAAEEMQKKYVQF